MALKLFTLYNVIINNVTKFITICSKNKWVTAVSNSTTKQEKNKTADNRTHTKASLKKEISNLRKKINELENHYANELKQIEDNFNEERAIFRTIIDSLPDAIYVKDINYRKIIANTREVYNSGYKSEEEVLGKTDFELYAGEIAKGFLKDDQMVIQNSKPVLNKEEYIIDLHGKKHWLLTSKIPFKDGKGNIVGLIGIGRDITEQKLAQEALREQTEKFQLIFEHAFDGISIYEENSDPSKRILIDCNNRYVEMSGRSKEDLLEIGNTFSLQKELSDDDSQSKTTSFRGLFSWIRPDGKENIIEYAAKPITIRGKIYSIGIDRDVTEEKQMKQALQKEKILLRTLIDNIPDGIYIKDKACRKTIANLKDIQNMGRKSEDEVINKTDFDLFPKEIAEKFYADDQSIIKTGEPVINREEFFIGPNGDKRWLLTSKLPLRDNNGEVAGIIGIGHDITEKKLFDERLQNERNLLKQLIDSLPDLIALKDLEGRYILSNNAHLECIGAKSEEDAYGKTSFDFLSKKNAQKLHNQDMKAINDGVPILDVEDIIYHNKYKEERWYLISKIPLKDSNGKTTGVLGVSHDITNRKKAEETLKKTYAELEKTNSDLQKANEVKGQFLANMSHEIRTPLNAIIGMAGLILDTSLNEEQKDYAETIHNSGDILLSLINDILDFSKIEAQKIELEKQPFDLRNCIEEALELVAPKAAEKNLELAYSIHEGLSTKLIGDVTRLRQILVNLLSNAVKFTERGEVIVSVSGQLHDHYLYKLHLSVRDTGLGISPDQQKKLFQSFTQVDASTTRKFGGTGLGLAISKQLSELMGGTMWVESSGIPGEGTTFHFTIVTEISVETEDRNNTSILSGKKVLIVDDNKTNREILRQQMLSLKMGPVELPSGLDAIRLIDSGEKFDIMILDYQMPEMDGIVLGEKIYNILKEKTPPLILLSSYGYRDKNSSPSKFAATLTKPIKLSHLQDALITVLKKNHLPTKKIDLTPVQLDEEIGKQCPLRILLAEDNKINQKVALKILEKLGYRADIASNGLEVLDAVNRQQYDLILMDIQMPEMDGEKATIEIRNNMNEIEQPQIVAMTANALKTDHDKYLTIGMDDCIIKPFKVEDLVSVLMKCYLISKKHHEIYDNKPNTSQL
jgi:PAS domain S-box-containing protein